MVRLIENRVLRKIFGSKSEELQGNLGERLNIFSSSSIVRVKK
jgi:hypothetical protein